MERGTSGPGSEVAGTIKLVRSPGVAPPHNLTGQVHLLPCCVKHDGPCPVSDYFKPKSTGVVSDGLSVEEAFFRGRKLQGATIPLPDGYCGFVLAKEGSLKDDYSKGDSNNWVAQAEFQSMTYWNHDSLPCQDDLPIRCFHWFSVANALHKPVTPEELASTSVNIEKGKCTER